eukprot:g8927.t1
MNLFTSFQSAMRCLKTAVFRTTSPFCAVTLKSSHWLQQYGLNFSVRNYRLPRKTYAALSTDGSKTDPEIDWDSLSFGLEHTGHTMYKATTDSSGVFQGRTCPFGTLELMPSAQTLNYGQAIFEGMKAQRTHKGRIVLFRPSANAERMREGALRMSMTPVPKQMFLSAVREVVHQNQELVPPLGKGSMYIRPLLLGTGPILGLGPAPEFTFLVYCAAVGTYFKGGQLTPIDLLVEEYFHRASPGGMGATKCAGNYSPVLKVQLEAKKQDYADVVYLDAVENKYLEEVSSCNIFALKGKTIKTPPLKGTILSGVTRRSVIQLAKDHGYTVLEEDISAEEAMEADEMFTTGTAVVLSPVGSLTYKGIRRQYGKTGEPTPVSLELYKALTDLQTEAVPDPYGWIDPVG